MTAAVDNFEKVAAFLPEREPQDGLFWYTELIWREKGQKRSNRHRILRMFQHETRIELELQMPAIRELCDQTGVRAYTRLSPRLHEQVGKEVARRAVDVALDGRWHELQRLYASVCGTTPYRPMQLWLFDVDVPVLTPFHSLEQELLQRDALVTVIPSKSGYHIIVKPHQVNYDLMGISVHKDNPTNLYIPASEE